MTPQTVDDIVAVLARIAAADLPVQDRRDILGLVERDQLGLARVALAGCLKVAEVAK